MSIHAIRFVRWLWTMHPLSLPLTGTIVLPHSLANGKVAKRFDADTTSAAHASFHCVSLLEFSEDSFS